ncbi:MAG: PilZ domain-containing protein [Pirellulaceae bacterium]
MINRTAQNARLCELNPYRETETSRLLSVKKMDEEATLCVRKERRYKTCDDQTLHCDSFVEFEDPVQGNVIDISPSGLRMLSEGTFKVGQAFLTELKTDQMHGVYSGIVRRVEPWVNGKSVLGVQLLETIPDDVLEALANEHVINRRREDRVDWKQAATVNWELHDQPIDVEIQDCSMGGLRIASQQQIPAGARLRIQVTSNDGEDETLIAAKTVWQSELAEGFEVGLAFITRDLPERVAEIVNKQPSVEAAAQQRKRSMRLSVMVAAVTAVCCFSLFRIGVLG